MHDIETAKTIVDTSGALAVEINDAIVKSIKEGVMISYFENANRFLITDNGQCN